MIERLAAGLAAVLAFSAPPVSAQPAAVARAAETDAAPQPPALEWTPNPGAFERDLLRRWENPLYPPSRRAVTHEALKAAIIRDAADARAVLADFMELALEQKRLSRLDEAGEIAQALRRFEASNRTALGVGGEASKLAAELRRIRGLLLVQWRERNADSASVLELIAATEAKLARRKATDESVFVAQLRRANGPIIESEQASALLSEDTETIALAMASLDSSRRRAVQRDSRAVRSYVQLAGVEVEQLDAKLKALTSGSPR